jgi:Ca-activated chloride channel family protein
MQPSTLPDLYAGQDLVVFGRYEAAGKATAGELSIAGRRSGQPERYAARVDFPAHASAGEYIPGLWAARKLGELNRNLRIEGSTPERVAEIRDLALRYGLLSEYTSYLVQEPALANAQTAFNRGALGAGVGAGFASGLAAAPSPTAPPPVTGQAAVEQARAATLMREARSQSEVAAAQRVMVDGLNQGRVVTDGSSGTGPRVVAGRTFRLVSGIWTDTAHNAQSRVITIEPFSAAYFKLLERLPEITPYLRTFDAVIVRGRDVSIRVAAGGVSTLGASDLDALVRDFRPR